MVTPLPIAGPLIAGTSGFDERHNATHALSPRDAGALLLECAVARGLDVGVELTTDVGAGTEPAPRAATTIAPIDRSSFAAPSRACRDSGVS
jgi:hypothetical protein